MYEIVLIRHGESQYNVQNLFTGWSDPDLTEKGIQEAKTAGKLLKDAGYTFDLAFASVLRRSIKTLNYVLDEMDLLWIPVQKSWKLNERHYGALQGLSKSETALKYGDEQLHIWRRSLSVRPRCWSLMILGMPETIFATAVFVREISRVERAWRTLYIV